MRPIQSLTVLLCAPLTLAAACGDDPVDPEPKTVSFNAARTELLAVREEGGDWRALTPAADGTATTEVTGPYVIASVCDTTGYFDYYTIHAAPEDGDVWEVWCSDDAATYVDVTVDLAQVGTVYIGFYGRTAGEIASVLPGQYDIIAIDDTTSPPRVAIQRDVEITGATTISVDVAAAGVAMNPVEVSATGADEPSVWMRVWTDDGTNARWFGTGTETFVIPPSLIADGDRQYVSASAGDGAAYRTASVVVEGDEPTVALSLPAAIASATLAGGAEPSVTWTASEAFDDRYFYLNTPDFEVLWDVMMFGGYAEALGAEDSLAIPDPTAIPGWNAAWNLTNTSSLDWYLNLTNTAADGSYVAASWDSALLEQRRAQVRPYTTAHGNHR